MITGYGFLPALGDNDIGEELAYHAFGIAQTFLQGGIHIDEASLPVGDEDHVRQCVQEGAVSFLASLQCRRRQFLLRDVNEDGEPRGPALVFRYRRGGVEPAFLAPFGDDDQLIAFRGETPPLAQFDPSPDCLPEVGAGDLPDVHGEEFVPAVAGNLLAGRVQVAIPRTLVDEDPHGRRFRAFPELFLAFPQGCLDPSPFVDFRPQLAV